MWRSSHGPIGKAVAGWSFPCLARRRPVEFSSVILAVGLTADSDADHEIGNAASCAAPHQLAAALLRWSNRIRRPTPHSARDQKRGRKDPIFNFWRRGWDSNPRYGKTVHLISNQDHSTTLAPLRGLRIVRNSGGKRPDIAPKFTAIAGLLV